MILLTSPVTDVSWPVITQFLWCSVMGVPQIRLLSHTTHELISYSDFYFVISRGCVELKQSQSVMSELRKSHLFWNDYIPNYLICPFFLGICSSRTEVLISYRYRCHVLSSRGSGDSRPDAAFSCVHYSNSLIQNYSDLLRATCVSFAARLPKTQQDP